jgi:polyisoprenoid-binding protein YceI
MSFKLTGVSHVVGAEHSVTGLLTLHGVTKEVTFQAEVSDEAKNPFGAGFKVGVSLSGKINREDFGLTWNHALETGGFVVGKEVHLDLDFEIDRPE